MDLDHIQLETERLRLVPAHMDHAQAIFEEFTPEITTYMQPKPATKLEDSQAFIRSTTQKRQAGEEVAFAILDKQTSEYLGNCGAHKLNTRTPELGIWIKKSAHGKKFGREAVTVVKQWIDAHIPYDYIIYPVAEANIASRKIPESLGGVVEAKYPKTNESGNTWECLEYRIYKKA